MTPESGNEAPHVQTLSNAEPNHVLGSVVHVVYGPNDSFDLVRLHNTLCCVPSWKLWCFSVKALYGNNSLDAGVAWIEITTGFVRTRTEAIAEYDRIRMQQHSFRHIVFQMQEATFSEEMGYLVKDSRFP
jgi:hypothetical protein